MKGLFPLWLHIAARGGLWRPVLTHAAYRAYFPRVAALDDFAGRPGDLPADLPWVLLRKRRLNDLTPGLLGRLAADYAPVAEGPGHLVLAPAARAGAPLASAFFESALRPFADGAAAAPADHAPLFEGAAAGAAAGGATRAIVVSTFNRPAALARSLPQIAALGAPVLVVDDGSEAAAAARNRAIAEAAGAAFLALPANRGLAAAINAGIAYWLADPDVAWISYFQDDVDVDPRLFEVLAGLEDAERHPLLSGFDTNTYETVRTEQAGGFEVKHKRDTTGMHLHGHRDYWAAVLPVPSRFVGAPKPGRGPSGVDTWIVNRAPGSVARRGLTVPCVAGLVRHFAWRREDSTWGNQLLVDAGPAGETGRKS